MYWQLSFSERENCNILPTPLTDILCSREWPSSSGSRISQTFNRWLSKKKKEKRFSVNISCYGPFEAGQEWLGAFCTCPSVHVEKRCPIKPLYKCLSLTTTYWKDKHLFFIRVDVCVCGFLGPGVWESIRFIDCSCEWGKWVWSGELNVCDSQ